MWVALRLFAFVLLFELSGLYVIRAQYCIFSDSCVIRNLRKNVKRPLRTVPTIATAHTFCASQDTRVSYGWCLLIQEYFCAV